MGIKDPSLKSNKKVKNENGNITIDAKHNEMLKHFQNLQKSLPDKKKDLKVLKDKYDEISAIKDCEFDTNWILLKNNTLKKIKILEKEIDDIISKKEEKEYFLNVGNLLVDYYENIEHTKNNHNKFAHDELLNNTEVSNSDDEDDDEEEDDDLSFDDDEDDEEEDEEEEDTKTKKNNKKQTNQSKTSEYKQNKSIIDFWNVSSKSNNKSDEIQNTEENEDMVLNDEDEDTQTTPDNIRVETESENNQREFNNLKDSQKELNFASMKMSDFVKQESKFKKKNILEEYLQKVDKNYNVPIKFDYKLTNCPNCNHEMTLYPADGVQICEKCGIQENVLIESDKPSFKDCNNENMNTSYVYKRLNHFSEWLAQFQAKETTDIPDEVYEKILQEIKKERITNLESLTVKKIRAYLKKIKCNKYYDHSAYILYQINGVPPPTLSKELEEQLRLMFKEIQGPFMKVCPRKKRKNFLNYSYVLHKCVELRGLDEYKKYFPLLKDRQKLHDTDMIWKKICEELGWEFIKSI